MTLSKIGANRVQSDTGFSLWMRNPFNLHYYEGSHELVIPGEMLSGEHELLVSVSAIKSWQPPFDQEPIDESKRDRIAGNVETALRFLGVRFEFD